MAYAARRMSMAEVFVSCLGFFIGMFLMLGDYLVLGRRIDPKQWQIVEQAHGVVWIFFIVAEFTFWTNIVLPMIHWARQLRKDYGIRFSQEIAVKVGFTSVFFAIPGYALTHGVPELDLAHGHAKMMLINLAGIGVAIVPTIGIWFVRAALESLFGPEGEDAAGDPARLHDLVRLRLDLQRFITILGAIIALATLAKGAMRQAYLAAGGVALKFPPEYIVLYGAYFTGLLALVYLPTATLLNRACAQFVDSVFPLTSADLDLRHLGEWHSSRKCLEDVLQVQTGALENLKASVSVLAPLAGSVISVLLGASK